MDLDPARREGQRDPSGADSQLQHASAAGQRGERLDGLRGVHVGVQLVVHRGDVVAVAPGSMVVIACHRRILRSAPPRSHDRSAGSNRDPAGLARSGKVRQHRRANGRT